MLSEILHAPRGAAVALATVLVVPAAARAAGPSDVSPPAVPTITIDQIPLGPVPNCEPDQQNAFDAAADETPAIVPLPPALATGLTGLAGMMVVRVGRRVCRRR